MTTFNSEIKGTPNFTIIVPGGCNANCEFCFWKKTETCRGYLNKLVGAIHRLPPEYTRCSISGGEPTLSPYLTSILGVVREGRDWDAVVLTTNGAKLSHYLDSPVDHVNLSRHHYSDQLNREIFGTGSVPDDAMVEKLCRELNVAGVDVTLQTVLCGQFNGQKDVDAMIHYARAVGASAVCFREDQRHESTEPPQLMPAHLKAVWSCGACRVWRQLVRGMPVYWKASVSEPSIKHGAVYELIFHPDGRLTSDWAGEHSVELSGSTQPACNGHHPAPQCYASSYRTDLSGRC